MTQTVQTNDFATAVLESNVPVLVDFSAQWCPPCQQVAPVVDELAEEYSDRAHVVKVDIDESPELAQQYEVMSIPSFFVFRDGKVTSRAVGVVSRGDLASMINEQLV